MDGKEMARMGGVASAAALTSDERTARAAHAAKARWENHKDDHTNKANRTRKKRLAARKAGRIAAASRKANRA